MPKSLPADIPPDETGLDWGCVFCKTGSENILAEQLKEIAGIREAFAVQQVQHRSERGVRSEIVKIMLPGYVFFLADGTLKPHLLYQNDSVLRLLTYGEAWALRGGDLDFARWMHRHGGLLGLSRAYRVGQRVTIASGPLKELEGVIQKVDRRNRNGLVLIEFCGKQIKVWLAFDYISEEPS